MRVRIFRTKCTESARMWRGSIKKMLSTGRFQKSEKSSTHDEINTTYHDDNNMHEESELGEIESTSKDKDQLVSFHQILSFFRERVRDYLGKLTTKLLGDRSMQQISIVIYLIQISSLNERLCDKDDEISKLVREIIS